MTRRGESWSSSPAATSRRCSRNNPSKSTFPCRSGKLLRSYVEALPWQRSWRLFIDFEPEGKKPVDMRATLALRGVRLTETFATVHRP